MLYVLYYVICQNITHDIGKNINKLQLFIMIFLQNIKNDVTYEYRDKKQ
jgi:hypothetical protein